MTTSSRRRFHGVIFDLDGTLVHSAPDIAGALNVIMHEADLAPFAVAETYRFIGCGAERLIADAFAARGHALPTADLTALTARYIAAYARRGSPDTTLYPGAADTVRALHVRGIPLAVCTNKAETLSLDVIAAMGLSLYFGVVIGSDSGFGRKPAAMPLAAACRHLGIDAANALMVGDTVTDVHAAQAARCTVAVVRHGYSQTAVDALGADFVLESVADVLALVTA